jgi:hypothetical protein
MISGAKSSYTNFHIIVARRYNEKLQRPPQLLVKPQ